MPTYQAKEAQGYRPAINAAEAGDILAVRGEIDLASDVGGALALNDVLDMVKLPAQHVPVDCIIDSDDVDTNGAPAIVFDAGLIGGTGSELISGSTVGQAGGIARMDQVAGMRLAPSDLDRAVGITVTTGPATGAATGKVGFTLLYRAASYGA